MRPGSRGSVPGMTRANIPTVLLFAAMLFASNPGLAQESSATRQAAGQAGADANASIVMTSPNQANQPMPSQDAWLQRDLEDAQARSRRSRNALIGTSAAFGLGAVLAGIGASQCQSISTVNQYDDLLCNNAGNVLLPLGGTIAGLSAIGMITSGIILGVANKRKREIQRDIRRGYYGRRLRWDVPSGGLVF
jgi:hypothetical protein